MLTNRHFNASGNSRIGNRYFDGGGNNVVLDMYLRMYEGPEMELRKRKVVDS